MTSTIEMRLTRELRGYARDAVTEIIGQPTFVQHDNDHGIVRVHKGQSLLEQLDIAKRAGVERVGGHSPLRSLSPLCVAALDLYQEIEAEWRAPGVTLVDSFRALPIDQSNVDTLRTLIVGLRAVAGSIRTLLDPPRRLHLAVACPACGVRTVFRPDESGELVQRAALTVDGTAGCSCLSCLTVWPPDRLEFLANVLGCVPL